METVYQITYFTRNFIISNDNIMYTRTFLQTLAILILPSGTEYHPLLKIYYCMEFYFIRGAAI